MRKFNVTLNYTAVFNTVVEAEDEGMAYDRARDMAEEANMEQFALGMEQESICECVGE